MPGQLAAIRGMMLGQFQTMAGSVASGAYSPYEFALEIEVQERSGVLGGDDVAALRAAAGFDGESVTEQS